MATTHKLPSRLHHTAYVSKNLEATRQFYEDVIGLPLMAAWCESDELFGSERTYCHLFFGLGDGSALAFFQFARAEDQALFGPKMPETSVPSHRVEGGAGRAEGHRAAPARRRTTPSRRCMCSSMAIAARCMRSTRTA